MLLVNPPASKPCEPPSGIACLSGALAAGGIAHTVLDANLEGTLALARQPREAADRWTTRALRNVEQNIARLREEAVYSRPASYARAVHDLERTVSTAAGTAYSLSLANLGHQSLSPLRSADLLRAADSPEDNPYYRWFAARLEQDLERRAPRVVGISITYLSQALTAFAMMGWLRRRHPHTRIVVGGGLVTSWASRIDLQSRFAGLADRFVAGPGERAVLELSGANLDAPPFAAPSRPGVGLRFAPRFDQLPMDEYLAPGRILPISASTGCWWARCGFCPERAEGNPYRAVPLETLRTWIDDLVSAQQPALLHFTDNAMSPALLRSLAENPPGVPWYGFARLTAELEDEGFCRDLAASGCALLKLGVESGSDRVLESMEKGFGVQRVVSALQALRSAGVPTYVYLLFGTPCERLQDARATMELVARQADAIGFLNLAVFNLPVQAPDAARLPTHPFYAGDLSLYVDFQHPAGWGRKEVKQFIDRELKRHPVIAEILRRDPPVFTSNHAPFFSRQSLLNDVHHVA